MHCTVHKTATTPDQFYNERNQAIFDKSLSIQARHLLTYMLDKPEDWDFRKSHLASVFGKAESTIQRWLAELRRAGYVTWTQEFDSNGDFAGGYYSVYMKPQAAANETRLEQMSAEREQQKEQKKRQKDWEECVGAIDIDDERSDILQLVDDSLPEFMKMDWTEVTVATVCFDEFVRTLKSKYRKHNALHYVITNLENNRRTRTNTAKIAAAKDETARSHVRREVAKAHYNDRQADQIRSRAPKTTSEKLHDNFMDDVSDFVKTDTSLADSINQNFDDINPFPEDDDIPT